MKGKRARKDDAPPELKFTLGDRVVVHIGGERFAGVFKGESNKTPGKFKVRIDASKLEPDYLVKVERKAIAHQPCKTPGCKNLATKLDALCDDCRREVAEAKSNSQKERIQNGGKGGQEIELFKASGVKWKNDHSFFRLETSEGVRFYGWYRKTRQRNSGGIAHCFDIYCKRLQVDGVERELAVDSLVYLDEDPRSKTQSLNADIVALVNRWYFQKLNGRAETLDAVLKRAEKPTIVISNLRTIDTLILRLKEYRDTAIRCGGERLFEVKGR
jgi:hypothetical protein